MPTLEIHQIPCLVDNYGYLIRDPSTGVTATVDTPSVAAIEQSLAQKGWKLDYIINTHHHPDHAGGNLEIKKKTGLPHHRPRADLVASRHRCRGRRRRHD